MPKEKILKINNVESCKSRGYYPTLKDKKFKNFLKY